VRSGALKKSVDNILSGLAAGPLRAALIKRLDRFIRNWDNIKAVQKTLAFLGACGEIRRGRPHKWPGFVFIVGAGSPQGANSRPGGCADGIRSAVRLSAPEAEQTAIIHQAKAPLKQSAIFFPSA